MYMRKNFYLVDEFDKVISRLTSSGLINYWVSQHTAFAAKSAPKSATLNLRQLTGVFEILFFGLLVSFVCFLIEVFLRKFKKIFVRIHLFLTVRKIRK